jgi:SAM-dependent methyltransferase
MRYPGGELELFKHARAWKRYWSGQAARWVEGRVLDAGCGIGASAEWIVNMRVTDYCFLEPDAALLRQVPDFAEHSVLARAERITGTTTDLPGRAFDTILYIDVLEHIADARAELRRASGLLAPGGRLIVLVPALPCLYSPFDAAIGHHRRYTKALLRAELPHDLRVERLRYLDSAGALLSLGNRLLLGAAQPTQGQVSFWDRRIVPLSRMLDALIGFSIGRSLLCVARKPA